MTVLANIPLAYPYINYVMGNLISETGWDTPAYIFLTEEVWRIMEITAEPTTSADIAEYYALLKWKALDQFRRELSTAYDYTAAGVSKHRSQMFKQVTDLAQEAKREAFKYLPEGQIEIGRLTFPDDPYSMNGQVEHTP